MYNTVNEYQRTKSIQETSTSESEIHRATSTPGPTSIYPRANKYTEATILLSQQVSQSKQVTHTEHAPDFLPSAILLNKFFHKSTKSLTIATLLKSTSLFKSTKPLAINPIMKNTSLFKSTKLLARKTLQTPTFPLPSKKDCYVRYSPFSICEVSGFLHNFP